MTINIIGYSAGIIPITFGSLEELSQEIDSVMTWECHVANGNFPDIQTEETVWINATPHPIVVNGRTFAPLGKMVDDKFIASPARCEETWDIESETDGVTFLKNFKYGKTNLPAEWAGSKGASYNGEHLFNRLDIRYIVSLPVALAEPNRKDLYIAVGQIRNERGQIIGAKGLAKL